MAPPSSAARYAQAEAPAENSRRGPLAAAGVFAPVMTGPATACTTAVVSGRVTADGRPLLWKNRDMGGAQNNRVVYSSGSGHAFLGVITAGSPGSVWMGVNEK